MPTGYFQGTITVFGRPTRVLAHRAAWALHYGSWPITDIDHIDMDKINNRITNLRLANYAENTANRPALRRNKLGVKGVMEAANGRYVAQIRLDGRSTHLGTFDTIEEASLAYARAARTAFGDFARC